MTEDKEKIYLSSLNKLIKSGSPKYLSYVSKEYMRNKDINPQIALAISCMIQKEANDEGSVYGIFLDSNGTINLDSMSDISRISNLSEFIGTVEDLAEFNIDFSDLTADELIIEGEQIAENLAREAEMLEQEISNIVVDETTDLSSTETDLSSKSSEIIAKATAFAGISAAVAGIVQRIKSTISRIGVVLSGKKVESDTKKTEKKEKEEQVKKDEKNEIDNRGLGNNRQIRREKEVDDSFCPIVKINVGKVVADTERKNEELEKNALTTDSNVDDNPADDYLDF